MLGKRGGYYLDTLVRKGLTNKGTFEQGPRRSEAGRHLNIPGRRNGKQKMPCGRNGLVFSPERAAYRKT